MDSKYCRKGEDRPLSKDYPEQLKRLQPDKSSCRQSRLPEGSGIAAGSSAWSAC